MTFNETRQVIVKFLCRCHHRIMHQSNYCKCKFFSDMLVDFYFPWILFKPFCLHVSIARISHIYDSWKFAACMMSAGNFCNKCKSYLLCYSILWILYIVSQCYLCHLYHVYFCSILSVSLPLLSAIITLFNKLSVIQYILCSCSYNHVSQLSEIISFWKSLFL